MHDYDLEYELQQFREEQKGLFDEDGKRYGGVNISNREAERMLALINMLEMRVFQICEHPYHSVIGGDGQPAKCLKCGEILEGGTE